MYKVHQISANKYGVEFSMLTTCKKKTYVLMQILRLIIKDTDNIVSTICGLDFNVEKVLLSIQPTILKHDTYKGLSNIVFLFSGIKKLENLIQFCGMFSEGFFSFSVPVISIKNESFDISAISDLEHKLELNVYDDGTYIEISISADLNTDELSKTICSI